MSLYGINRRDALLGGLGAASLTALPDVLADAAASQHLGLESAPKRAWVRAKIMASAGAQTVYTLSGPTGRADLVSPCVAAEPAERPLRHRAQCFRTGSQDRKARVPMASDTLFRIFSLQPGNSCVSITWFRLAEEMIGAP